MRETGWPAQFDHWLRSNGWNSRSARAPLRHKAQEMLAHPPAGQPMTGKQTHYFQALAHGWTPGPKKGR